jgi:two-component system copper resistance phosphate regulon response regulator CusR
MVNIGLAEDDVKIAGFIKRGLEETGYLVHHVSNGNMALQDFNINRFDLLILDILMPGINGLELCKELRKDQPEIPIIMLTALGTTDDKVTGLSIGADDYLVKPFHFAELLARIKALLRRSKHSKEETSLLSFADININTYTKTVTRNGLNIELTAKEYALLELFIRNPNRLLSRQYIAEHVWDLNFDTGTNVIDVYVNFLRNKIDKGFSKKLIHTKIGMGYVLKETT